MGTPCRVLLSCRPRFCSSIERSVPATFRTRFAQRAQTSRFTPIIFLRKRSTIDRGSRNTTAKGWVILTKDKRIRRNELEKKTLESTGAAAFILTAGEITGQEMATAFVAALPKIRQLVGKYTRPLICTVRADGTVTVLTGLRRGGIKKK